MTKSWAGSNCCVVGRRQPSRIEQGRQEQKRKRKLIFCSSGSCSTVCRVTQRNKMSRHMDFFLDASCNFIVLLSWTAHKDEHPHSLHLCVQLTCHLATIVSFRSISMRASRAWPAARFGFDNPLHTNFQCCPMNYHYNDPATEATLHRPWLN